MALPLTRRRSEAGAEDRAAGHPALSLFGDPTDDHASTEVTDQYALGRIPGHAGAMRTLVHDPRAKADEAALGGGESARVRHTARGKLLPRDRVAQMLDPGTPFLEIGQLAAHGMYDGDAPSAGMIAGIGRIQGVACMVVANDATVKGGTRHHLPRWPAAGEGCDRRGSERRGPGRRRRAHAHLRRGRPLGRE
jgi:hypothetical protein